MVLRDLNSTRSCNENSDNSVVNNVDTNFIFTVFVNAEMQLNILHNISIPYSIVSIKVFP